MPAQRRCEHFASGSENEPCGHVIDDRVGDLGNRLTADGGAIDLMFRGLRRSELLAMTTQSITGTIDNRSITVTGKGRTQRTVPVPAIVSTHIDTYLDDRHARYPHWISPKRAALWVTPPNQPTRTRHVAKAADH
jgi:site-specific recombinase XerC